MFLLAVFLLIGSTASLSAQDFRNGYFVHEFWAQLEPMVGGVLSLSGPNAASPASPNLGAGLGTVPEAPPASMHQAITEVLKEAQYVYSGMIYGFSFSYTPVDPARGIPGSFSVKPIAEIKWGDPHLRVLDTRVDNGRLTARILYTMVPFQETWTQGWDSNVFPSATGRGTSRYFLSYDQKMASYKDAMKEAIRGYLRQRIFNRPRKVVGQFVLRGSPQTIIDAGRYVTTVSLKLRINKVVPYRVF